MRVQRLALARAGPAGQLLGANDVGVTRARRQRFQPPAGWALAFADTDLPHRRSLPLGARPGGADLRLPAGRWVVTAAGSDVLDLRPPGRRKCRDRWPANARQEHRPHSAHRSSCPTAVVFIRLQMRIWRISAHRCCSAGCHPPWLGQTGGHLRGGQPVRRDAPAIGKQRTSVLEHHDAVAEQVPSLFGMRRHHVGRLAIWCVRGRAGRLMLAHDAPRSSCRR